MLLSVAVMAINALAAPSLISNTVTQSQIDKLKEEKREYERQKREINSRINTIEYERMAEIGKKEVLDQRIMLTGLEIDNINATIVEYNRLIREKENEVIVSQNREEEQLRRYRARVRDMEENGVITYLEIIFDSTSFSDLLARLDFVSDIMQADEDSYRMLQLSRNLTEQKKVELEITKSELDGELVNQELMMAELEMQLEEAHALIKQMEDNLETERQLRALVIEEEDRVQREINAKAEELRKKQEEERLRILRQQQQQAQSNVSMVTGTGELMWPTTSKEVTSPYGIRTHPIYGDRRMHNGIDINAAHGANIYAADSGTVITSTYNSGYGNYVVVSHGNGMTTLYAHMSSRSVSVGASVSKGQVIGLIGSTGVSTGPHLHFEVSVNGTRINPLEKL